MSNGCSVACPHGVICNMCEDDHVLPHEFFNCEECAHFDCTYYPLKYGGYVAIIRPCGHAVLVDELNGRTTYEHKRTCRPV